MFLGSGGVLVGLYFSVKTLKNERKRREKRDEKGRAPRIQQWIISDPPCIRAKQLVVGGPPTSIKMGGLHGNAHPIGKEIIFCAPQKSKGL